MHVVYLCFINYLLKMYKVRRLIYITLCSLGNISEDGGKLS